MAGIQVARPTPGIVAPPIVDSTNHVLYAFYGHDLLNGLGQVAQGGLYRDPALSTSPTASLDVPGTNTASFLTASVNQDLVADGAFTHSYFSGFSPPTSFLYICGSNSTGAADGISLQQVIFGANRMLSGVVAKVAVAGNDQKA